MSRPIPSAELEWTAFRYIAGELSAAEASEFEEQLSADQAACEAVARAVQLTEAVSGLAPSQLPMPTPRKPAAAPRRNSWAAIGVTAACVCLAIGALVWERGGSTGPALSQSDTSGADRLLNLWEVANPDPAAWVEEDDFEAADEDDFSVPSWMLAAAEIDAGKFTPAEGELDSLPGEAIQHN